MKPLMIIATFLVASSSIAQTFLKGTVMDKNNAPIIGATIKIYLPDTTYGQISNLDGSFSFSGISYNDSAQLEFSFVGFIPVKKTILLKDSLRMIVKMVESEEMLEEVVVETVQSIMITKGDTTELSANAFKAHIDASSKDLLLKMPGISSQEGTLTTNGKEVEKILIDGKSYGDNENATQILNTLPAEAVDKVQVYDDKTEESKQSGIDDGKKENTINIITKKSFRNSVFGDLVVGGADKGRYMGDIRLNYFGDKRKFTFSALTNNINSFGGDYANPIDGVVNFNGLFGVNEFYGNWIETIKNGELSLSYSFSNTNSSYIENERRSYFADSTYLYNKRTENKKNDNGHKLILRFNKTLFKDLKFSLYSTSYLNSFSAQEVSYLNTKFDSVKSTFNQSSESNTVSFRTYLTTSLNYKLDTNGKSIYLKSRLSVDEVNGERDFMSKQISGNSEQNISYLTNEMNSNRDLNLRLGYNQPLNKVWKSTYEIVYGPGIQSSEIKAVDQNEFVLIDSLSSLSSNDESNFEASFTIDGNKEGKFSTNTSIGISKIDLYNNQTLGKVSSELKSSFIIPNFSNWSSFTLNERNTIKAYVWMFSYNPRAVEMREVIDPLNTINPTIGNKNLKPNYDQISSISYTHLNKDKTSSITFKVYGGYTFNQVTQNSFIVQNDTVVAGTKLNKGITLNTYSNISGKYDINARVNYSFPVDAIKSKLDVKAFSRYENVPFYNNNNKITSETIGYGFGTKLTSNISEKIDFTIRGSLTSRMTTSDIGFNQQYLSIPVDANLAYELPKDFSLNLSYNGNINSGFLNDLDIHLLNMSLGKRFGKNKDHKIQLSIYDALAQNVNYQTSVDNSFFYEREKSSVQRFVLLSYSLKIRNNKNQENEGGDLPYDFIILD